MNRSQSCASGLVLALTASAMSSDIVLHDNGLVPDGVAGSAIGSPMVPDVRVAEDFVVPEGDVWTVTGLRYVLSPGVGMEEGPVIGVRVCTDSGGDGPLSPFFQAPIPFTKKYIGDYFGRPAYEYTVGGMELVLGPGVYWTSPTFPQASEEGYAIWLTARVDDVRQQRDLAWFSPDGMETWFRMDALGWEGDYWHHGFQVLGHREGPPLPERTGDGDDPKSGDSFDGGGSRGLKPAARGLRGVVGDDPLSSGDLLWNNDLVPNGVMARAISPPGFPNIRVAEDFVVPRVGWIIRGVHWNVIEDPGWTDGGDITTFIHRDMGGPGIQLYKVTTKFTRTDTGDDYFGRNDYDYWIEDLNIEIDPGNYWIGIRNGNAGGAGTNYLMTSDGGRDGGGSDTGWFSLDFGQTWQPEGDPWHHAFEIRGELGIGSIALPQRFEVTRGVRVSGGLVSLSASDDEYLLVEARRPSAVSQPSVQVVVDADGGGGPVPWLEFTVEAATTFPRLVQWIDFFDFDAGRWVRMDTREATTNDSVVVVSQNEDAERFRDDKTGVIRARVSFWDPGLSVAGWFGRIDQTVWRVGR